MPYRIVPLINEVYYHIYNRGVEKRSIFACDRDYQRFLQTLFYYRFHGVKFRFSRKNSPMNKDLNTYPKYIEIICYCFMPNHFHLLVRQIGDNGIQKFMQRLLNSYTKYFNVKHKRVGPLFQGSFKAVPIETNEQLVHISRYIHLNPYVSKLTDDSRAYQYSSYRGYIGLESNLICNTEPVLSFFRNSRDYEEFVEGHGDYARELELMKHILMEEE